MPERRPPEGGAALQAPDSTTVSSPESFAEARARLSAGRASEAARLLVYRAACLKDRGEDHNQAASMAKLFASEVAAEATRKAVQIFGGYGCTKAYKVERLYRDAKLTEIFEGTSEIQRIVIARKVLGSQLVHTR